jgi:DNA invertase Pin-like site-specific DNA recombinase
MIAAIYARKSTDQSGVADDAKSVRRQIEHARAYAARHGWTVRDEYVFLDDGISGAEFANRPGFVRLMASLNPRAPFQVLVMSEESRLGREAIETAYALKQLITAGVRIFFYLEGRERTFDSPTDKLLMSVTAFADELEREKARQRTYDAMQRKARAGHVTGGRVFGYDNVVVLGTDGQRSHVERRINEAEAAIVRRVVRRGRRADADHQAAQRGRRPGATPQQGRPVGWAHSTVRAVLLRELYRGVIVWNQTRKRDRWGQHRQQARPDSEWLRVPAPAVRIVSEDLWRTAHTQLSTRRRHYAQFGIAGAGAGRGFLRDQVAAFRTRTDAVGFCPAARCGSRRGVPWSGGSDGDQRVAMYPRRVVSLPCVFRSDTSISCQPSSRPTPVGT